MNEKASTSRCTFSDKTSMGKSSMPFWFFSDRFPMDKKSRLFRFFFSCHFDGKLVQLRRAYFDDFLNNKKSWSFWYLFLIRFRYTKTEIVWRSLLDVNSFECTFSKKLLGDFTVLKSICTSQYLTWSNLLAFTGFLFKIFFEAFKIFWGIAGNSWRRHPFLVICKLMRTWSFFF